MFCEDSNDSGYFQPLSWNGTLCEGRTNCPQAGARRWKQQSVIVATVLDKVHKELGDKSVSLMTQSQGTPFIVISERLYLVYSVSSQTWLF